MLAIDQALESKSWGPAANVWTYIKSRRRELRRDLNTDEAVALETYLASKRSDHIYILSLGALESYLPAGHNSKDLDKLIRFLANASFWDQLPDKGKPDLESIARGLLPFLETDRVA